MLSAFTFLKWETRCKKKSVLAFSSTACRGGRANEQRCADNINFARKFFIWLWKRMINQEDISKYSGGFSQGALFLFSCFSR